MSRRGRSKPGGGTQLFSFLDAMICTMGALVVLLHAFARHGQIQIIKEKEPRAAQRQQEQQAEHEDLQWRVSHLQHARAKTEAQLVEERLKLSHVEDHERRLRQRFEQLKIAAAELDRMGSARTRQREQALAELETTQAKAREARAAVEHARREAQEKVANYTIVPYEGPNHTHRRPVYIECRGDSVVLQPEGIELAPGDFVGVLGAGNPLAAALRSTREYLARESEGTKSKTEPYPLLLVRPDGIEAYYAARAALNSWASEFGYELISSDWQLKFAEPDPRLAELTRQVVAEARIRQQEYIATSPQLNKNRPRTTFHASSHGGFVPERGSRGGGRGGSGGSGPGGWDSLGSNWAHRGGTSGDGNQAGGNGIDPAGSALAGNGSEPSGFGSAGTGTDRYGGMGTDTGRYGGAGTGTEQIAGNGTGTGRYGGAGTGTEQIAGNGTGTGRYGGTGAGTEQSAGMGTGTGRPGGAGTGSGQYADNASGGGNGTNPSGGQGNGQNLAAQGGSTRDGFLSDGSQAASEGRYGGANGSAGADQNGSRYGGAAAAQGGQSASSASGSKGSQSGIGTQNDASALASASGSPGGSGGSSNGSSTAAGADSSSGSSGASGSPGGSPGSQSGSASVGGPTFSASSSQSQKHKSMANSRGQDWGLPDGGVGSAAATRPIMIECYNDRLVILPESKNELAQVTPLGTKAQDSMDQFVSHVWQHMKGWGMAGKGLHWRPTLLVQVEPGAADRYAEVKALLDNSGLDVQQRQPRSTANGPAKNTTRK